MTDHTFCRLLLKEVMADVRKHTTAKQRKAAWAYRYQHGDQVEFHGPDGHFWHGRGCCSWHARAQGWEDWMKHKEIERCT